MATTLTPEQMKRVLRRAAELERRPPPEVETSTERELVEIGTEVGLSDDAIRYALAELRSGVLPEPRAEPGWMDRTIDRTIGPTEIVLERTVPGPVSQVRARVDAFLSSQLLRVKRHFGDHVVWEHARGLLFQVRRAVDLVNRFVVPGDVEIESVVAPVSGRDEVLVRLTLVAAGLRRSRTTRAAIGLLLGAAAAAVGVLATPGHPPIEVVSVLAGGGAATGSVLWSRRSYRRTLTEAETALARLLDDLEHRSA